MTRPDVRALTRWLADSARYFGALVYWNARKSAYVFRGRTGRCPCQNPSDDPVAGHVRCDAVALWHRPERFRSICPLLVRGENGWCCSVPPAQVRPFWRRALLRLGTMSLAVYLIGAAAVFGWLRFGTGARLSPLDVAWPGSWSRVRHAQADVFFGRAIDAFRQGDFHGATLALSSARAREPRHYEATLLLAQVTAFQGSAAFSDEMFVELMRHFPEQRRRTAVTHHDTLLMLGRFDALAELSLGMARGDQSRAAVWVRSLVFSLRHARGTEAFITTRAATIGRLAPHARQLIEVERLVAIGQREGAVQQLRQPFHGPFNPIYMRQQVERLTSLGAMDDAQTLLDFYGPILGEFEHHAAQFGLDLASGDAAAAAATLRALLATRPGGRQVERLAEELIRHPLPEAMAAVHAHVVAQFDRDAAPSPSALWVAAVRCGASGIASHWRAETERRFGERVPRIDAIDFESRSLTAPDSAVRLVNVVTFPRDIVVALLEGVSVANSRRALP